MISLGRSWPIQEPPRKHLAYLGVLLGAPWGSLGSIPLTSGSSGSGGLALGEPKVYLLFKPGHYDILIHGAYNRRLGAAAEKPGFTEQLNLYGPLDYFFSPDYFLGIYHCGWSEGVG